LYSVGVINSRKHEISKELEQLRKEKSQRMIEPNQAKELFKRLKQSVNVNEWISHGNAVNRTPDSKLRATPGGQNDGAKGWNEGVEDWGGVIKGDGDWWGYVAGNDWNKKRAGVDIYITEDDKPHKISIKIKTHGLRKKGDTNETFKERVRKHAHKVARSWISAAKKLHETELNEVGNEIKKYWKESFKNSLESIKQYIVESGESDIDSVNFTHRK
jgi:hypothetical protein